MIDIAIIGVFVVSTHLGDMNEGARRTLATGGFGGRVIAVPMQRTQPLTVAAEWRQ